MDSDQIANKWRAARVGQFAFLGITHDKPMRKDVLLKTLVSGLTAAGMLALSAASANAALDDTKAQDMMKKSGCATCHFVDKKLIGPMYKDVALKRKADAGAAALLQKAVREGSKGVYGPIPMPPNPPDKISDADVKDIVEWILTK